MSRTSHMYEHSIQQSMLIPNTQCSIEYEIAKLLALALSTITQQTFEIPHSFKQFSRIIPMVSLLWLEIKQNLNIFFIQFPPFINVMNCHTYVIHILN